MITDKEFKEAVFIDNKIKYYKNLKRQIELKDLGDIKPIGITVEFNNQNFNKMYLDEPFIKEIFGLVGFDIVVLNVINQELEHCQKRLSEIIDDSNYL